MSKKFDEIHDEVISTLENKLPSYLTYHSIGHTEYVLERASYIAEKENVSKKDVFLLKIAALYHDIGFIKGNKDHEITGCKIAREQLSKRGFTESELETICGMIMATKIPQEPNNLLEKILADADLEYLATKQFKEIGDTLFQELKYHNKSFTESKWNQIQIDFLKNHEYHTNYCRRYKSFRKKRNLQLLQVS